MKELELYADSRCTKRLSEEIDFGEWDIALGAEFSFYIKNPNDLLKAKFGEMKNSDPRSIVELPDEIKPDEVKQAKIKILPISLDSGIADAELFADIYDQINGSIKWVKA